MSHDEQLRRRLDEILERAVARGALPCVALSVVARDGSRYDSFVPTADGRPFVDGPLVRLASVTKLVVTIAALTVIEKGTLGLDDDVRTYLPDYGEAGLLAGFQGGVPEMRPITRTTTVRHLLTHTSGHGYWFANPLLNRFRAATGLPDIMRGEIGALRAPVVAEPGTRWEYGISTDWLGRIIEAVTGDDLATVVRGAVLDPLELHSTTFSPTPLQRRLMVPLYERAPSGAIRPSAFDLADRPQFSAGGHGLYSTAHDIARVLRLLLRGGELDGVRLLTARTVDAMFVGQIGDLPLPKVVRTQDTALLRDVQALPVPQTWGLGMQLTLADLPDGRRAGSGFWSGIFNTYFWIDRRRDVAVVFLTQLLPFADEHVLETLGRVESEIYRSIP